MTRKNILGLVSELMNTDSENPEKQTEYLVYEYNKANKKTKEALDMAFIALCGYSLKSLMDEPRKYFQFGGGW